MYFITIYASKEIAQLHAFQYCWSSFLKFSSYGAPFYAVRTCETASHGWTFDLHSVQSLSRFDNSKPTLWLWLSFDSMVRGIISHILNKNDHVLLVFIRIIIAKIPRLKTRLILSCQTVVMTVLKAGQKFSHVMLSHMY